MRAMSRCFTRLATPGPVLLPVLLALLASPPATADEDHSSGLQNLRKATEGVWSGGAPTSVENFRQLARMGVKTIVSVDGARPDLAAARKAHLRYVHIPIGYDGIGAQERLGFVRLAKEGGGPIYIHCHHGRHRAPAAAAIVCQAAGRMERAAALDYMKAVGTSRDYAGLWRDVEAFRRPGADVRLPELVEVAAVDSLAAAMAGIDRAWDRLEALRGNGWKPAARHPDVRASREALLLEEGFHESVRALKKREGVGLETGLKQAEEMAKQLRSALVNEDLEAAVKLRDRLKRSCSGCHRKHRN